MTTSAPPQLAAPRLRSRASSRAGLPDPQPSSSRPSVAAALAGRPPEPWTTAGLTRVVALTALGLLVTGVAWFGASGTITLSHQLLWLVLGIAGAAIVALGEGMFVLEALRAIKARRLAVMVDLQALLPAAERTDALGSSTRVASAVMTHFHLPSCPLVAGKETPVRESAEDHLAAGRTPCGVCAA